MKHVLVTGSSRGLGRALFDRFRAGGWFVVGLSRSDPDEGADAHLRIRVDLTHRDAMDLIRARTEHLPRIDVLVNNAGLAGRVATLEGRPADEIERHLLLHCVVPARITQALLPKLVQGRDPTVVNITSRLGSVVQNLRGDFRGTDFPYSYRIAKAAQNMLTLCMLNDPTLHWLRVLAVNPGRIRTVSAAKAAAYDPADSADRIFRILATDPASGIYHAFGEEAAF